MQFLSNRRDEKLRRSLIVCVGVLVAIGLIGCNDSLPGESPVDSSEHRSETVTAVVTAKDQSVVLLPDRINDEFVTAVIRLGKSTPENDTSLQLFGEISITPGWHIYAANADSGAFSPTVVEQNGKTIIVRIWSICDRVMFRVRLRSMVTLLV